MANGNNVPAWIEKVKSGGAVPLLDPDHCPNGWATPPGDVFMVRGPQYFSTKVKIPAGNCLLKPIGFDWMKSSTKISDVLKDPNSRVRKAIENDFSEADRPFIWAFNIQVPSKENYSAVAYFISTEPPQEGSLVDQFLKGDDSFRNSRLKLIANIVKGPWIVKKAAGEQAICIIGRALKCKYSATENFFEVDVDIGSSMVASAIVHVAFNYITTLTVDLAFLIESQTESELPEKILGAFRFSELNPASAQSFNKQPEQSAGNLPSASQQNPWWRFLIPGTQENGSTSALVHANGTVDCNDSGNEAKKW
ncbi:hypothetical protein ACFE04_007255 [Oxalis oulophora]